MDQQTYLPLLKPMLAQSSAPFDHPDHLFEVKWDGYRCLAYLDRQGTTLRSRNLKDISSAFPDLDGMHTQVQHVPLVLDGEIIVLVDGKPSFHALQSRAKITDQDRILRAAQKTPALYMAFDMLYYCGQSLMQEPLYSRRKHLATALRPGPNFSISEQFAVEGLTFFQACVQKGLEGMVAKKKDSKYLPGIRSPLWKKVRHTKEADLVICGYRPGKGSRLLGALVLGAWNGEGYIYRGLIGSGFSREDELFLLTRLKALATSGNVLIGVPGHKKGMNWVQPRLVCRVEYLGSTKEGLLRHPVYKGLRRDKLPQECLWVDENFNK